MNVMHKMAIAILTTMIGGAIAAGASSVYSNSKEIASLKAYRNTMHSDIKEIKSDVKYIIRNFPQEKQK